MNIMGKFGCIGAGLAALILTGCNLELAPEPGRLDLDITDAPVDSAEKVVVVFTGVTLQAEDGTRIELDFNEPKELDLLSLQNGETASLLDEQELKSGDYEWIRLLVMANGVSSNSYIEVDGARHQLVIPSGSETGLKLVSGFTVDSEETTHVTIDFDLRKSVVLANDEYKLKPALRLVDNSEAGHISGTVDNSLIGPDCHGAVYAFSGADVTPGDMGGLAEEPVTTTLVDTDETGVTTYEYDLSFLNAGDYTLSFTCEADQDDPEAADSLMWEGTQTVTVTADQTTEAHFGP